MEIEKDAEVVSSGSSSSSDSRSSKDSVSESGNAHSLQPAMLLSFQGYNDLKSIKEPVPCARARADVQYFSYPISYHAHVQMC
uniref:Uncharacterized protein n=1 Tax=Oryza punctata TaxID=4537 RepID=A0A0E0KVF4_ORYPU